VVRNRKLNVLTLKSEAGPTLACLRRAGMNQTRKGRPPKSFKSVKARVRLVFERYSR
jgi:hypothetical protein